MPIEAAIKGRVPRSRRTCILRSVHHDPGRVRVLPSYPGKRDWSKMGSLFDCKLRGGHDGLLLTAYRLSDDGEPRNAIPIETSVLFVSFASIVNQRTIKISAGYPLGACVL